MFHLRLLGVPLISFVWALLAAAPRSTPQAVTATRVSRDHGHHVSVHYVGRNREGRSSGPSSWGLSDRSSSPLLEPIPKSVELASFIETSESPSSGGIWAGLKRYVELGTSGERIPTKDESKIKEETNKDTSGGDTASPDSDTPVEAQPSEATESKAVSTHEHHPGKETGADPKSETYHRMAQKELRDARTSLVKQTNGTPEEYGETGSFPSLCGSWQTVPSSPHFPSNATFTRYSEQDASLLEDQSDAADALPYPTCQWLPRRGIHISERRTYGFEPNVVSIERLEFHSEEGCLPTHLAKIWRYSGYWHPESAAKDSRTKAEEMSVKGNFVYSQAVPPEFIILPQEIPVSHEVLANRLKHRLRRRLSVLQQKHGKAPNTPRDDSLKSEAEEAIASNWTDTVDRRFVTRWRDYLVQQNRWTEKVCQWHLLRESCLVPPPLAGPAASKKHTAGGEGKKQHESHCYIPSVRHSLTREDSIDYLSVPLFPFTKDAEHVRLRKVGGCNPHLQVSLRRDKDTKALAEEQKRHSAEDELASVAVTSKTIHPHDHASAPAVSGGAEEGTTPVPSETEEKGVRAHGLAENTPQSASETTAQNAPAGPTGEQDLVEPRTQEEPIKAVTQQAPPVEQAPPTEASAEETGDSQQPEQVSAAAPEQSQQPPQPLQEQDASSAVEQPPSFEGQTEPQQAQSSEAAPEEAAEKDAHHAPLAESPSSETADPQTAEAPAQEADSTTPAFDASSTGAATPTVTEVSDQEGDGGNEESSSVAEESSSE
ncbi:conserved hypothetical protein [Neospora caninum Liverpool]|uniref:Rhoptry neck protein RON10 n=1 Tax=Neospora caninum (strain Liverpool) TaxID=572307 RepID=F0VGE1_NEOCL|nr:conserved hypothetical protein [Neospora caninum Liverpool]CBZ52785.1 conserved hypothetical protein [Neospora caninum Liverpool]|eukprot:XP_003882817.1 conserved hypothetical protein [Neospora caninum Liverpool]